VLDIAMPGMSGPDLQRELTRRRKPIPIVFITANEDSNECARILDAGSVCCLIKPFSESALLRAVTTAIQEG
jgi:FixJ family two-component response regulator